MCSEIIRMDLYRKNYEFGRYLSLLVKKLAFSYHMYKVIRDQLIISFEFKYFPSESCETRLCTCHFFRRNFWFKIVVHVLPILKISSEILTRAHLTLKHFPDVSGLGWCSMILQKLDGKVWGKTKIFFCYRKFFISLSSCLSLL